MKGTVERVEFNTLHIVGPEADTLDLDGDDPLDPEGGVEMLSKHQQRSDAAPLYLAPVRHFDLSVRVRVTAPYLAIRTCGRGIT